MTWDEQIAEDEHLILGRVREQVDWSQAFQEARIAVRVGGSNLEGDGRANLANYEQAFTRVPLMYQLVLRDAPAPKQAAIVIDAGQPFQEPRFQSEGGALPDELKQSVPLQLSQG